MRCPECGGHGVVYGGQSVGTSRQRYRRCKTCGHRWSTWEEIEDRAVRPHEPKALPGLFGDAENEDEGTG